MSEKRLNLEDIARKAGVSRSTVSRVINNDVYVNAKTREKVMAVIEREGFTPNPSARALVTQRTRIIGVVIPLTPDAVFFDNAFYFPTLLRGIADTASERDYAILLWLGQLNETEEQFCTRIVRNRMMDGLILASTPSNTILSGHLLAMKKPFVQVERPVIHVDEVSYVTVDNVAAAKMAVQHLIALGRRRIGIVTGVFEIPDAVDRLEGYKQALIEAGIPIDESLIYEGQFLRRSGYAGSQILLERGVDAIFGSTDIIAIGVVQGLQDAGVRVPEDVSVVGFDDSPAAVLNTPHLTTVRQPVQDKGARATSVLIDLIEGTLEGTQCILLPTELIVRETTSEAEKTTAAP